MKDKWFLWVNQLLLTIDEKIIGVYELVSLLLMIDWFLTWGIALI